MTDRLAIDGGPKAITQLTPPAAKIGVDELMSIIELWNPTPTARKAIAKAASAKGATKGAFLFRYYGENPGTVARAEETFARMIRVKNCLGVNSGTSALIASLRACGIGAGDEVIIPAYTFFATAAAVVACNAIPIICEIDDSLNIDAAAARKLVSKRTKAIMPVHMRGVPAQMDAVMDLANEKGLLVIEDVAQATGGSFKGKMLGSIGTMGCFSLDYFKVVAAGEGGFITTNDDFLYMRAQSWHDTAACWRPNRYGQERVEGELFCGENYRMNEIAGALAVTQLKKLDTLLGRLRENKSRIKKAIGRFPGMRFRQNPDTKGDICTVLTFVVSNKEQQHRIVPALKAEGVPAASPYSSESRDWHVYSNWDHIMDYKTVSADGLPWSAVPKKYLPKYRRDMCPRTLDLLGRSVSLAISPDYTPEDCDAVAGAVNKVLRHVTAGNK